MATYTDFQQRQLDEQSGRELDKRASAHLIQHMSEAITLLYTHGIMTAAERDKARKRLVKQLVPVR